MHPPEHARTSGEAHGLWHDYGDGTFEGARTRSTDAPKTAGTAHTPGPWFADKLADRAAFNIFPAGSTYALLTVAPPEHDSAGPVGLAVEANARLIAAAPELLSALRACVEHMEWSNFHGREARTAAVAAIAKATGAAS